MSVGESRKILAGLIEKYNQYKDDKSFMGNEKQVCQSLIVPLIRKILHWDTEEPSEFKTEESQSGKRIDYVVLNQGISQFIVEAKAPSKDIFDNEAYYQQALGYGYGKQKDFAILTNFRQVVILACQVKCRVPREAELARFNLLEASEEELQLLLAFEKEYWLNSGKNNLLISKMGKLTKTIPIDEQLLGDLKEWREQLLRSIKSNSRHNKFDFEDEEEFMRIEEEVQKFIDRLIFICFCEDKELHESHLKRLIRDKHDRFESKSGWLLDQIQQLFVEYRRIYDSDLFDKNECDTFVIDDNILLDILKGLREPKGRAAYDFKSIEADILGKAYENFIGHIQTGKKRFKEKEDIGKRKKEGIYYTPKYIVDYIINNTVREYIKGKSFAEIKKVRILDPACGSGSFLRVVLDVLIEESQRVLKRNLTYDEKKELLLGCIYGVDLDQRAVEIAKFNLSLKLAERGQNLPILRDNIRCGNSLIDDKEIAGYRAFDWNEEFKEIMDRGGFDVVVGNPPYVNNRNLPEKDKLFFEKHYQTAYQQYDIYVLFYEKGLQLLKEKGHLGFIAPNKFAITKYGAPLRMLFLKYKLVKVMDVSNVGVFVDASTYPYVVIVQKSAPQNNKLFIERPDFYDFNKRERIEIKQNELKGNEPFLFNLNNNEQLILNKVVGDKVIDIYRAKPTSKEIGRGNGIAITNKEVERYGVLKSIKKISNKGDWLIDIPAILMKKICFSPTATLTTSKDFIPINTVYVIHSTKSEVSLEYLLAVINSKLIAYYTRKKFGATAMQGGFIELRTFEIESIPIKMDRRLRELLQEKVNSIQSLKKQLNDHLNLKAKLEAEIQKIDHEIDNLVYKLYGITEEEKKIIEESLK